MTKTELVEWCRTNRRDGALFGFGLSADGDDLHLVESDKSGFNYREGVPAMYMARTGKKVVRADINGMGRMVSQAGFFNASGGYYTFDPAIAEAIGGYPYGAILRWKDPDSGLVRIVRSLKPDNKDDFVADPSLIDGDSWDFADRALPMSVRPRVFPRWDLAAPAFSNGQTAYLGIKDEFTAHVPGMFLIQAGAEDSESIAAGESEVVVWAEVRKAGDEDYHSAGMLAYIPPVANAYSVSSTSSMFVDGIIEQKTGYSAKYVAGWVTLWLLPGDSVRISTSSAMDFRSQYVFVPVEAQS